MDQLNAIYTSGDYRTLVKDLGMRSSAGGTGVCWDNAMAESFFSARGSRRPDEQARPPKWMTPGPCLRRSG